MGQATSAEKGARPLDVFDFFEIQRRIGHEWPDLVESLLPDEAIESVKIDFGQYGGRRMVFEALVLWKRLRPDLATDRTIALHLNAIGRSDVAAKILQVATGSSTAASVQPSALIEPSDPSQAALEDVVTLADVRFPSLHEEITTDSENVITATTDPYRESVLMCFGRRNERHVCRIYNIQENRWLDPRVLPFTLESGAAAIWFKKYVYFFGGGDYDINNPQDVIKYSPVVNVSNIKGKLESPMCQAGVGVLHDYIYIVNGINEECHAVTTVQRYDPSTGICVEVARTGHARSQPRVLSFSNFLYVLGSSDEHNVVECYDPDRDVWTSVTSIPGPMESCAAVIFNEKLVVVPSPTSLVHVYDFHSNSWVEKQIFGPSFKIYGLYSIFQEEKRMLMVHDETDVGGLVLFYDAESGEWMRKSEVSKEPWRPRLTCVGYMDVTIPPISDQRVSTPVQARSSSVESRTELKSRSSSYDAKPGSAIPFFLPTDPQTSGSSDHASSTSKNLSSTSFNSQDDRSSGLDLKFPSIYDEPSNAENSSTLQTVLTNDDETLTPSNVDEIPLEEEDQSEILEPKPEAISPQDETEPMLFCFGKQDELHVCRVYNVRQNSWSDPKAVPFHLHAGMSSIWYHGYVYVVGGGKMGILKRSAQVIKYNFETNTVDSKSDLAVAVRKAGLVVLNSFIYIFNGSKDMRIPSKIIQQYNPRTGDCTQVAETKYVHKRPTVCSFQNSIYILSFNKGKNHIERFDPATNYSTVIENVDGADNWGHSAFIRERSCLVFSSTSNQFHEFEFSSSTWSTKSIKGSPTQISGLHSTIVYGRSIILVRDDDGAVHSYDAEEGELVQKSERNFVAWEKWLTCAS